MENGETDDRRSQCEVGTYTEYILSQEADEDEVSVMHRDIRGFHDDDERLWVTR